MKKLFAIGIMLISLMGCGGRNAQKTAASTLESSSDAAVQLFIFHAAQRCATCKAIDAVVAEILESDFEEEVKSGTVVLRNVDGSKPENRNLMEKYEVFSTSLILDAGGKVTNLTNDAFQYARSNPDRLMEILRAEICKAL